MGGNVLNVATHHLKRRGFDVLFYLFSPVRDNLPLYTPNPERFKTIYSFYSTGDQVQYWGSKSYEFSPKGAATLLKRYMSNLKKGRSPLKGGRKLKFPIGVPVYNFRAQYEGHSFGHIHKISFVRYLPKILALMSERYLLNYDFDLDINPQLAGNEAIFIVIRHPVTIEEIAGVTDNSQELEGFKTQLAVESQFSESEEKRYERTYRRSIHEKGLRAPTYFQAALAFIKNVATPSKKKSKK